MAQPGDLSEQRHAGQGEDRVAEQQPGDHARRRSAGQDELGPDPGRQQYHGGPSGQAGRITDAHVELLEADALREPLDLGERGPKRAERWPRVAEQHRDDWEADPGADPEEDRRERRDIADHEADHDRAVPPHQADRPQHHAHHAAQAHGYDEGRVPRLDRSSRDQRRHHERGRHRGRRSQQVQVERDGQLEGAADGMPKGWTGCEQGRGPCDRGERDRAAEPRRHAR